MLAGTCQLLLGVWKRNSESADTVLIRFALLLLFDLRALGANLAPIFIQIKGEVHSAAEQFRKNVLRLVYLLVILFSFCVQRRQMKIRFFFFTFYRGQLLKAGEVLASMLRVSHHFVNQRQPPARKREFRSDIRRLRKG